MSQALFQKKFDRDTFAEFARSFVSGFEVAESRPEELRIFKKVEQIGISKTLDLVVFAIENTSGVHARVEITKNAYSILKAHGMSHALIAFYSRDSDEWRLSLITTTVKRSAKGVREEVSSPRRFSYVLGPEAKITTPSKQLSGTVETIKELLNKFSLEVVNQDFYEDISRTFTSLVGGTRKRVVYERSLNISGHHAEAYANFAIRLIGRLVFCWFLKQKKSDGGKSLVSESILGTSAVGSFSDYYHTILCPLFFEILNKPLTRRPSQLLNNKLFNDVPYLNGGLFSPHDEDKYKYDSELGASSRGVVFIPDTWFTDFFKILEKYNFTIDENISVDTELSVDPEMLGRIFENLLAEINPETGESARKATGSFYTPREIVEYMVDESLVAHLVLKTGINETKIRSLNSYGSDDDKLYSLSPDENVQIVRALHHTTILDPSCGSGAFPIGALQKIVYMLGQADPKCETYFNMQLEKAGPEFRKHMQKQFDNKNLNYIRKLGVIRECIHGIDIQPIATDISRLRCFLTLVVDQHVDDKADNRGLEPLPNLDFKFMCANSLVQPKSQALGGLFSDDFTDELSGLINEYFSPIDLADKRDIEARLKELITNKVNTERDSILDELLNNDFANNPKTRDAYLQKNKDSHDKRRAYVTMWESYLNVFRNQKVEFFDTKYFFPAVYKSGGFDIILANPPYVGEKGNKENFRLIAKSPLGKKFYQGKMDLFYFFFHLALNLGNDHSQIAYITTNYFPTASGARKLREDFKNRAIVRKLVNFNELKIFKSAAGQHNMLTILTKGQDREAYAKTCITKRTGDTTPNTLENIVSWFDDKSDYFEVNQNELYDGEESYIRLTGNSATPRDPIQIILSKIKFQGTPLGDIAHINQGVVSGCDYVSNKNIGKLKNKNDVNQKDGIFVFDLNNPRDMRVIESFTEDERRLLRPFFKNSDISKYWCKGEPSKLLLYLGKNTLTIENFPNIQKHLSKYLEILNDRREVLNGRINYYHLQWYRVENIFTEEKITVPYRSESNSFAYNNREWFCRSDSYVITRKNSDVSLKYLLSLLNSKLYYLWLYHRGKRKGETLELFQVPLSEIPIKKISESEQIPFIQIVDKILEITKSEDYFKSPNKQSRVKEYEAQIDKMISQLYGLSPDEIQIIEDSCKK